jgi:5-methylcytosine-specific restriction protein A
MPTVPSSTKCSHLGCKNKRSRYNSSCLEHGGIDVLAVTRERKDHNAMYQSVTWKRLRQSQLSTHPLCASCLTKGRATQAQHVDHVFPWSQYGEYAFTANLFQSLCPSCHSEKTYWETKGIYKHYGHTEYKHQDYSRVISR